VRNWPLAVSAIRSRGDRGCIDRGKSCRTLTRVGREHRTHEAGDKFRLGSSRLRRWGDRCVLPDLWSCTGQPNTRKIAMNCERCETNLTRDWTHQSLDPTPRFDAHLTSLTHGLQPRDDLRFFFVEQRVVVYDFLQSPRDSNAGWDKADRSRNLQRSVTASVSLVAYFPVELHWLSGRVLSARARR
jgi:hypothetical protein